MDRDTFWNIIEDARRRADDVHAVAGLVVEKLQTLEVTEIVSFSQQLYDLLAESYRYDLWAVAYIVNGGCSDDGFDYFRAWLVAQGRERFEAALENPAIIGQWAGEDYENECEDLLGAGWTAHHLRTGAPFPPGAITIQYPPEPLGRPWEEDELAELYPELHARFYSDSAQ